jgi:nitrite reductase/ring-hydroxylating ferredoxin subunit
MKQDRRQFIKTGLTGACVLALGGISVLLQGCTAIKVIQADPDNNIVKIPVSEFGKDNLRLIRSKAIEYDILLVRESEQQFHALQMKCTHQSYPLKAGPEGLNCPLHDSTFDMEGNATKGPASIPLKRFKLHLEADQIIVKVS